jgi:endonuclease YncB( thermonuclease family)
MKDAQLEMVEEAIAVKFFGRDAYNNENARVTLLKPDLRSFVRTLLSNEWNQVRKATKNQYLRLQKGKRDAKEEHKSRYI